MKIILTSVGTRGDVEPFLAIGEILQDRGHQILCLFPEQFRDLAEDANLAFASLGTKFIEMLESSDGKAALGGGGSGIRKMFSLIRLARNYSHVRKELIDKQFNIIEAESPDRIVHNGKAIYVMIWGLKNKGKTILISPIPYVMHYVKGHTHLAFNSNYGSFLNKLTYGLATFGLVKTVQKTIKKLKIKGGITYGQIRQSLLTNKAIYTISPSLFTRPDSWSENIRVLGYQERNKTANWRADAELESFLKTHECIVFITFGSMTNPEPEKKTRIILEVLERNNIPAIINTASGGLEKPSAFDSYLIHFVSQIPYDWIFPKVYAVVHHGGSGTTHLALKYGCATMIIPHVIDQFVWNRMISDLGAGPRGMSVGKLNQTPFEQKILDLLNNQSYKVCAQKIAKKMSNEAHLEDKLYLAITE